MTPERYRLKLAAVDAVQVTVDNVAEVAAWADDAEYWGDDCPSPALFVASRDGSAEVRADLGDWVLRDDAGRFFVLSDGGFKALYERHSPGLPRLVMTW